MNSQVKDLWVSSLRSGDFKKGKFGLHDLDECYDATGVLCRLAVKAGVIPEPVRQDNKDEHIFFGYVYISHDGRERQATGLLKDVQEWSGVSYRQGMKVAMMGDNGKSFDFIADYIEEKF